MLVDDSSVKQFVPFGLLVDDDDDKAAEAYVTVGICCCCFCIAIDCLLRALFRRDAACIFDFTIELSMSVVVFIDSISVAKSGLWDGEIDDDVWVDAGVVAADVAVLLGDHVSLTLFNQNKNKHTL